MISAAVVCMPTCRVHSGNELSRNCPLELAATLALYLMALLSRPRMNSRAYHDPTQNHPRKQWNQGRIVFMENKGQGSYYSYISAVGDTWANRTKKNERGDITNNCRTIIKKCGGGCGECVGIKFAGVEYCSLSNCSGM